MCDIKGSFACYFGIYFMKVIPAIFKQELKEKYKKIIGYMNAKM